MDNHFQRLQDRLKEVERFNFRQIELIRNDAITLFERHFPNSSYLDSTRSLYFEPQGVLYNTGHYKNDQAWDIGTDNLKEIIERAYDEWKNYGPTEHHPKTGKIEIPKDVTFTELWSIFPAKLWVVLFGFLTAAFGLGITLGGTTFIKELFK